MTKTKYDFLPKSILRSKELTPTDKLIYLHLFHICTWGEEKTINVTQLSKKLGIGLSTAKNSLNKTLQIEELITIDDKHDVKVFLEGIEITDKTFHKNSYCMNMLGNFVKIPTQFIYDTNLTPVERLTAMMVFDFYFDVNENGFKNKGNNVNLKSVATCYGVKYDAFKKNFQNLKKKGAVEYTVFTSSCKSKIYGLKFFKIETVSVYMNGKTTKTNNLSIKTKEEVIEEPKSISFKEEKETEYTPTKEDIEVRNYLINKLSPIFKEQFEKCIIDNRIDEQIIWLKKHQPK